MDSEKIKKLYERAEKLKQRGDFDKAYAVYKEASEADHESPKGFWGMVLCKYGILYEENGPVMKRPSDESIMEDEAFERVMENAEGETRSEYRNAAKELERLRRKIAAEAEDIEGSDIFICLKHSDADGSPTPEAETAKKIGKMLEAEGYKIFFSRGMDAAHMLAALKSSGLMIVAGSDYENFHDADVKNEWGSFLKISAADKSKRLICVYSNCDEFDIPKEFSKFKKIELKGDDFSEVEAAVKEDLDKDVKTDENAASESLLTAADIQTTALLKRGFMSLEDGDFTRADEFFEQALNIDPECPLAYWGKTLCLEKVKDAEEFAKALFEKIASEKDTKKVELPSPDLVELARNADTEKGLLKEFEDTEIYKLIQDLEKKISYDDSRSYFEDQAQMLSAETLRKLIDNRDYDRAVRYADEKTKEHLEKVSSSVAAALNEVINAEKEKAGKAMEDAEKAREEIFDMIKKRLENVASEMDTRRAVICALSPGMKKIMDALESIKKGDEIVFGSYYINDDEKAPVAWKVLKREKDRALLVTSKGIDTLPYHDRRVSITWENSFIRHYMNDEMLKEMFTDEERSMLLEVTNENPQNEEFKTYGGKPTKDVLFLFSIKEAEEIFKEDEDRCTQPTEYAKNKGAYIYSRSGTSWWWLRSPGNAANTAARVASFGYVYDDGYFVNYDGCVVRPAVWVDLSWTKDSIISKDQ